MKDKKKLLFVLEKMNTRTYDTTTIEIPTNGNDMILLDNRDTIKKLFNSYVWVIDSKGYPIARINGKDTRLHQLIIERCFGKDYVQTKDTGYVIDHLNNNHCDNRLRNLHILPTKNNNDKELLDFNFDNMSVYIEYNYDFKKLLISHSRAYTQEEIKKIYDDRKYVLSYISKDIVFCQKGKEQEPFNIFDLVYDNYDKFIKDVKEISVKTKEVRRITRLVKKNSEHKDLKRIKSIKDIKLNKSRLKRQKQAIEKILVNHEWQEIRNVRCNIMSKQEFEQLSEQEKNFYLTLNNTVYQYLPPDFNINKKS